MACFSVFVTEGQVVKLAEGLILTTLPRGGGCCLRETDNDRAPVLKTVKLHMADVYWTHFPRSECLLCSVCLVLMQEFGTLEPCDRIHQGCSFVSIRSRAFPLPNPEHDVYKTTRNLTFHSRYPARATLPALFSFEANPCPARAAPFSLTYNRC